MLKPEEKERLKEESLTNLEGALEELKTKLPPGNPARDTVLHLLGRAKDISQPEKLHELIKYAYQQSPQKLKGSDIQNELIEFYSIQRNRIRMSLFGIINEI